MDNQKSLEHYKDEVLRKIGRKMLLFQQMEHLLKFIVLYTDFESSSSTFSKKLKMHKGIIGKASLGKVVGKYISNTLDKNNGINELSEEITEPHLQLHFRWELDEDVRKKRKKDFESIVADRNRLIHNLLPQFDPGSIESCVETISWLDDQHKTLLPQLGEIKGLAKTLHDTLKKNSQFLKSKEGEKMFLEMTSPEKSKGETQPASKRKRGRP